MNLSGLFIVQLQIYLFPPSHPPHRIDPELASLSPIAKSGELAMKVKFRIKFSIFLTETICFIICV
jgi:hypothetical protein